jgi:hypothetical protein
VRREIQDDDRNRKQRQVAELDAKVPGEAAPEGQGGAGDEEQCRCN